MAKQISPKLRDTLLGKSTKSNFVNFQSQEEPYKKRNKKKKTLLAAFKTIQKCPHFYDEYIEVLEPLMKEKDHGIWISLLPLFELIYKRSVIERNQECISKI